MKKTFIFCTKLSLIILLASVALLNARRGGSRGRGGFSRGGRMSSGRGSFRGARFTGARSTRFTGPRGGRFTGVRTTRLSGPRGRRFTGFRSTRLSGPRGPRLRKPRRGTGFRTFRGPRRRPVYRRPIPGRRYGYYPRYRYYDDYYWGYGYGWPWLTFGSWLTSEPSKEVVVVEKAKSASEEELARLQSVIKKMEEVSLADLNTLADQLRNEESEIKRLYDAVEALEMQINLLGK